MMKSPIIVTGGCGFIGSCFLRTLIDSGWDSLILVLDRLTYAGRIENLKDVGDWTVLFQGDIANPADVDAAFEKAKPSYVVNFAAESHVDRSIEGAAEFIRTNVVGTQVLLDACLKHGVRRFLQVSTDEVYGDIPLDVEPSKEADVLMPSSPYSASKAAAELLALSYVRTHDLDVVISRSSNNYGPRQFPEKLIPLMLLNALDDKALPVYGTGENIRDWIHVDDNCKGILAVLEKGAEGEVYNLGGGNQTQNIWIVKTLLKLLDKPESLIEFVTDRKGHDFRYSLDCSKAQVELDWQPEVDFQRGLADTVRWYLANDWWWKPLREES